MNFQYNKFTQFHVTETIGTPLQQNEATEFVKIHFFR